MNDDHATGEIAGHVVFRREYVPLSFRRAKLGSFPSEISRSTIFGSRPSSPTIIIRSARLRAYALFLFKPTNRYRIGHVSIRTNAKRNARKIAKKDEMSANPAPGPI